MTHVIHPACTIASVSKHSLRCDLLSPSVPQTLTKQEYEAWLRENYGSE